MNNNSPVKPYLGRVILVLSAMIVLLIALAVRLFYLHIFKSDEYRSKAFDQYTTEISISPKRGTIYDRNMTPLAVSATVETVFISPYEIEEKDEAKIADYLSEKLGVNRAEIVERMTRKNSKYQVIKKKVDTSITDEIRQFIADEDIKGIHLEEDTKRFYPYGNLASNVIGFTNSESVGIYGVESYYENYLKGSSGKIVTAQNAKGKDMPFQYESYVGAENGTDVVLTIDWQIQSMLEKHLQTALEDTNAQNRVLGIIMDVNTGDILAMSTKPDYDPNNPYDLDEEMQMLYDEFCNDIIENEDGTKSLPTEEQKNSFYKDLVEGRWKNKAITELYEPGSTFKIITSAMALEENLDMTEPSYQFNCTGSKNIGGYNIGCHKRGGHGIENFEQGLQNSCNPVFMELAEAVGRESFYKYFESYGFTEKTGIDLAGEVDSIYHRDFNGFNQTELAVYSFGQTFKITPLSLIRAVSAVANGGNLMQPRVVKALVDDEGNIIKEFEPYIVRQVNSPNTSETIMRYLANGITIGSTKNAYVKDYSVGAKTGTSQKRDILDENLYIASCVAFAPAEKPEIAILIAIDEPEGAYYGGTIAAPVVSSVLSEVLPYLNVETSTDDQAQQAVEISLEDYTGLSVSSAKTTIKNSGLTTKTYGNGDVVIDQYPKAHTKLRENGVVVLYTEEISPEALVTVPDVVGQTPPNASQALVNSGLNIIMDGAYRDGVDGTVATRQTPEAGSQVAPGTLISVEFHHLDNSD
ncbi:MAG: PASTA domain-containing protein [Clostridia bacterium]|nr:PASTA domain-containing protein [Clostridia bacterium]